MAYQKTFELGVYSFGNTPRKQDGSYGATAQAVRDVLEAAQIADAVGLDFFGFGEHHTRSMPLSSPASLVNAAAAVTKTIKLGTSVSVLPTEEPIRLYQQLATAAAIAPSRVEIVAGRGSSSITFPIFDLDQRDYDTLFRSKLELLLALNGSEAVTWNGPHRSQPIQNLLAMPRPEQELRIWLGTGGNPGSVGRAAELGLPLFIGILGGPVEHWRQYSQAYRDAWDELRGDDGAADLAIGVHGFVAEDGREAKATYLEYESRLFQTFSAELGRPVQGRPDRTNDANFGGMVFAGDPDEIADRILDLRERLGHSRQIFHMDVGGMPHADYLRSIELLGTKVRPQIAGSL